MLDIKEAVRKPFAVKFVEVTLANIEELAKWCGGTVEQRKTRMLGTTTELPVIVLVSKERGRRDEATLGCYIVGVKNSYRVYKPAVFEATFDVDVVSTEAELLKLAEEVVQSVFSQKNDEVAEVLSTECEA